jgi:hypothetical protein
MDLHLLNDERRTLARSQGGGGALCGQGTALGKRHPLRNPDGIRHAHMTGGVEQDLMHDISDSQLWGGQ